jgi:hypothetical protein
LSRFVGLSGTPSTRCSHEPALRFGVRHLACLALEDAGYDGMGADNRLRAGCHRLAVSPPSRVPLRPGVSTGPIEFGLISGFLYGDVIVAKIPSFRVFVGAMLIVAESPFGSCGTGAWRRRHDWPMITAGNITSQKTPYFLWNGSAACLFSYRT